VPLKRRKPWASLTQKVRGCCFEQDRLLEVPLFRVEWLVVYESVGVINGDGLVEERRLRKDEG
jgi:hypothetical protein